MGDCAGRRGDPHRRRSDGPRTPSTRRPSTAGSSGPSTRTGTWTSKEIYPEGGRGRAGLPRPVAGGDHALAPQSADRLPRLPVPLPVHEQGRDLGADQPRPDLQQPRRAGPVALRHPLRLDHGGRRIAVQVRRPLRRDRRRPGLGDQDERRQPGPRSRPASPTTSTSGRSSPPSTIRPRST
ncbi:MAG: hypothetical protein MZV64_18850 [Ignavibacteriales bacterium]|nr:hypothetical protein [Ignavibacteriales bacterium]